MIEPVRFIDLARHGGCSRKVGGLRLAELLRPLDLGESWSDAGSVAVDDAVLVSSTDLLLPMIDDPELFGQIVVSHVLSDIYAAGGEPLFGLNVLGLPPTPIRDDEPFRAMLASAAAALKKSGAVLLGGHTVESDELFFGLAATGRATGKLMSHDAARPGDILVLTKPLGTSIATVAWKIEGRDPADFVDVVDGMVGTNALASRLLRDTGAVACTDVTGFGLLGHLHNLLRASGVAARIDLASLPRYASTEPIAGVTDRGTRLLEANEDFVCGLVEGAEHLDLATGRYVFDAQVSGGLLAAVPEASMADLAARAEILGQRYWVVGEILVGDPGHVSLA